MGLTALSVFQGEGDDGQSCGPAGSRRGAIQREGELSRRWSDGCGSHLLLGRVLKAELADAESFAHRNRRPEEAAGLRAGAVEIAGSVLRIERRAWLVVGEVLKLRNRLAVQTGAQEAGGGVSGELSLEARPRGGGALPDAGSAAGILLLEGGEAGLQPESIRRADGKGTDAALGTAGTAEEMRTAAFGCVGKGSVDQGDEAMILNAKICLRLWWFDLWPGVHSS